ncbi:aldehyde dehydrogenase family protein [Vibrio sp. Of7-15]|uniref:aldehyde dehydrogenase family protein n=1 Tax=Vibrio sp. Of7-15 TaxID=2724879 RepID=UPI001EF28479|nr:aldehyde dehydrogenase family protein [Vibrio sp. Of7-15]MCG7497910.1 aldehyde dehydrogenase family protein [Vibrio sp. Of7-15]
MAEQIQNHINLALSNWEAWNCLGVSVRSDIIMRWADSIAQEPLLGVMASKMAKYQARQAVALLAEDKLMPGPTGETNELYSSGRGVFAVTVDNGSPISGLVAHMSAALLAGNCVILSYSSEQADLAAVLQRTLIATGVSESAIQLIQNSVLADVVSHEKLSGVAYVGSNTTALALNRQLAARAGLLAQLIAETDLEHLTTVTDSHFILRFITERTRTINITAVGGNATLLELGSGSH